MYMRSAKILYVKGRQHPVKIYHSSEGQSDYVDSALRTFFQIHTDQPPGDVLIFLPGFFFLFSFFSTPERASYFQPRSRRYRESRQINPTFCQSTTSKCYKGESDADLSEFYSEFLGSDMPDVCCPSSRTKCKGVYDTSAEYAKMYIGD